MWNLSVALALSQGNIPPLGPVEAFNLLVQGICTQFLGFAGLSVGPKYIAAAEVALFLLIETILGPIWVYLGGYESPPPLTVYGGALIVGAMALNRYGLACAIPEV